MVKAASSSKSNHSRAKSTHTSQSSLKIGPPAKKPVAVAVSVAKAKKTKQESIKKYVRTDENANALPKGAKTNEKLHAQYAAELKKLQAENNALRKAAHATAQPTGLPSISRPAKGVAGNGFNLRAAMGLGNNPVLYCTVRRCIRTLADRAGLDYTVPWHGQPKETVGKIIGAARARHDFLNQFPHGWPVEEFLKTYLKNKRAYARKKGYLTDNTNQKKDRSRYDDEEEQDGLDDDDEDSEQEQEEQHPGQEQEEEEQHPGQEQEEEDDFYVKTDERGRWFDRGNGWGRRSTDDESDMAV